jgi:outer membrane protein assembly factor BamB
MMKHLWVVLVLLSFLVSSALADWPAARGNAQRTGNVDGKAGPKTGGKVFWAFESTDHYISTPSPGSGIIFAPALGTLNSGVMSAISTDPGAGAKRVVWTKSQPFLKLPTVCAPAVVGGRIIFGDGMHQNESPTLYCLDARTGTSIWQLSIPGALIHLEGTPTVAGDRAFFGAGNGGVMCVDVSKVTLDGKETDAAAVAQVIAKKWAELQKKYEEEKKRDPDFAIPPSEDSLPKPAPKLLWQQGAGAKPWHVDCPVAVAGDKVLAGSAFLESENTGERALFCMNAGNGEISWRADLKYNPWGGPSVSAPGDLVVVGCSSIRFDPKDIPGAKGEVVAIGMGDGKPKWHKEIAGGVVSPVTLTGDLAIFTATDKKVHALSLKDGEQKWIYEAKAPFFGGVAVAADMVYAADLNGVLHAIGAADGKGKWKLDVGRETKAPGNIYGSPVVDGGRIYVGTCNLDAADARKTVIVCIGER